MKTTSFRVPRLGSIFLLAFFLLPLLNGCTALWPWKQAEVPTVSLADMELQGIKGLETIFLLKLRVVNSSGEPLEIKGLTCGLDIEGSPFAKGVSDEHLTIPASGSATVAISVYTTKFELVGSVIELLEKDMENNGTVMTPLRYALHGEIRLGAAGKQRLPFHLLGSLSSEK